MLLASPCTKAAVLIAADGSQAMWRSSQSLHARVKTPGSGSEIRNRSEAGGDDAAAECTEDPSDVVATICRITHLSLSSVS